MGGLVELLLVRVQPLPVGDASEWGQPPPGSSQLNWGWCQPGLPAQRAGPTRRRSTATPPVRRHPGREKLASLLSICRGGTDKRNRMHCFPLMRGGKCAEYNLEYQLDDDIHHCRGCCRTSLCSSSKTKQLPTSHLRSGQSGCQCSCVCVVYYFAGFRVEARKKRFSCQRYGGMVFEMMRQLESRGTGATAVVTCRPQPCCHRYVHLVAMLWITLTRVLP